MKPICALLSLLLIQSIAVANETTSTPTTSAQSPQLVNTQTANRHLIGSFTLVGSQSSNQSFSNQTTSGIGVNALIDFQSNKKSFETGLSYLSSVQTRGQTQKFTYDLKTISIPIALKYLVKTNKYPLVYLKGGLNPTFLLSATHHDSNNANGHSFGNQGFDLQALGGVGAKFKLDETKDFNIEALYIRHVNTVATNMKIWDEALQLGLGVGVGF